MTTRSKASQAYSKQKERARTRSSQITLVGQEIAPIPPRKNPHRRLLAEQSFRVFCETYFPHVFTLAWSDDHLRVIAKIERVVWFGETLAVAMPRGSGKTSLAQAAVQWAILGGWHKFVYLIANTDAAALSLLANIKAHLAGNELLAEDFPEAISPIRRLEGETRRCAGQRYYGVPPSIGRGHGERRGAAGPRRQARPARTRA